MLTDVEKKRLAEIREHARSEVLDATVNSDLAFLAGLVEKLGRPKVEDWSFPRQAALVNDINGLAYPMKFETIRRREFRALARDAEGALVGYNLEIAPSEAELAARPYVRLAAPLDGAIERLSAGTFSLSIDGMMILERYPLRVFLADPEGYAVAGALFSWKGHMTTLGGFFRGVAMRQQGPSSYPTVVNVAGAPQIVDAPGWVAVDSEELGIMLPNRAKVEIKIRDVEPGPPIPLAIGILSALYSTRSQRPVRKQDWSPRDEFYEAPAP